MRNSLMLPGSVRNGGSFSTTTPARKSGQSLESRFESAAVLGTSTVVLADVSGSMQESVGPMSKFELMQAALGQFWPTMREAHLVAFSSNATVVSDPASLPAPDGRTALAEALQLAATFNPRKSVLICDGHPNNPEAAIAASRRLAGYLDVLYCGPSNDTVGIEFMRRLAQGRNGRVVVVQSTVGHRNLFEEPLRLLLGK
jgi:hypothetical protein